MGKRKPYWNYVKSIIRQYPELKKELETPLDVRVTAVYDTVGGSHGSGTSDPTGKAVVHDLSKAKQRKYDAVENAIIKTKQINDNWQIRLKIIDLVYWRRTHTLAGAAQHEYVHMNTACRYQAEFIKIVAEELDLP